ncbi:MAG: TonB-dependent receptor plug domain-containing protein [Candidatus Sericytochromatia bacterium]|nr:TonB-dependent receptor plug domain-containing protein [Candidatus Tanganyikabacteria bacterium]
MVADVVQGRRADSLLLGKGWWIATAPALAGMLGAVFALAAPAALAADSAEDEGAESLSLGELLGVNVVSATKAAQSLREAPAIMDVITDRDLRERGYASVAEALQAVPGFCVLFDYVNYNVGVRGISSGMRAWSRILKVMIDGQSVALRVDSTNFLGPELIPLSAIKRIEIIRAPPRPCMARTPTSESSTSSPGAARTSRAAPRPSAATAPPAARWTAAPPTARPATGSIRPAICS